MRFLSKITFINSATIKYAEIALDGNVHLIGTQGAGKTTLLRAILFFYNAETTKLGLSKDKKSFVEYYFPYQNSYVVYDVTTERGTYCIIAFKSQGRVSFRFIDTAYKRQYFIADDGRAYERWEDIVGLLTADRIYWSRKVDRYEEYRDILYGNNSGRPDFRKYALLESKQYQNIPRTIQNVFLNSKLEAEFIKQTIINSLADEDVEIDLQSYTHHLKDFESQLADVTVFRQAAVIKQIGNITETRAAIRHLEREKQLLFMQLLFCAEQVHTTQPRLREKEEKERRASDALLQKIEATRKRHESGWEKLQQQIGGFEEKLKTIREKSGYYAKLQIDTLLSRSSKKPEFIAEQKRLLQKQEVLRTQYKDVTQKYELLFRQLESSITEYKQARQADRFAIKETNLKHNQEANEQLRKELESIRQNHSVSLEQAKAQTADTAFILQQHLLECEGLRHSRPFEKEIVEAKALLGEYTLALQQGTQKISSLKGEGDLLQKHWELEEAAVKQRVAYDLDKLKKATSDVQSQIKAIEQKIADSQDSFYGWLNAQVPGWEESIGKVINEQTLFHKELAPKITGQQGLYGVSINLDELQSDVKTIDQYREELDSFNSELTKQNDRFIALQEEQAGQLEKAKKAFAQRLKVCKLGIAEAQYSIERHTQKAAEARLDKERYEQKAIKEKADSLQQIQDKIDAFSEAHQKAKKAYADVEESLRQMLQNKEKESRKKMAAIDEALAKRLKGLNEEESVALKEFEKQKAATAEQQQYELAGRGADIKMLDKVADELKILSDELAFIEAQSDVVAGYNKDKNEWLDKTDEFKAEKLALEQRASGEKQKHQQQIQTLQGELSAIKAAIVLIEAELKEAEEDTAAFERFQSTEAYKSLVMSCPAGRKEPHVHRRITVIIEGVNDAFYSSIKRVQELNEAVYKFLSNFSDNNVFKFTTNLIDSDEYFDFAESLADFVEEGKIDEFEKRVAERFASIIRSVGKETKHLMSRGDEIRKVIVDVNKDFERKNFVGAIKRIELRIDDSANQVVTLLLKIQRFNDEHGDDIGVANLFTQTDSNILNKEAVNLLKQLCKSMASCRERYISLSDSFELKFRIEENQNDTGWVEKLSNVGSDGTDVLVKAMINIMLLNVFKERVGKSFKDFRLHCMMDEIGKLHPNNIKGILQFANDRNILLINGSPTENNAMDYRHIFKLEKDAKSFTKVKRILSSLA